MKNIVIIILILLTNSCAKPKRQHEITKVDFARGGAWSDYGAAISVDSSLNYRYYDANVKNGYYKGKLNQKLWDTLNYKLEKLKFKTLDESDSATTNDATYFEAIIYWKSGQRRITRVNTIEGDSVVKVLRWINNTYKKVELSKTTDSIKFETTFQNQPDSPIPKGTKFYPPPLEKGN